MYSQAISARLPTAVREMHTHFSPVQAVARKNAKKRTLRELASIIVICMLIFLVLLKIKQKLRYQNMMKQRMLQKTKILKT